MNQARTWDLHILHTNTTFIWTTRYASFSPRALPTRALTPLAPDRHPAACGAVHGTPTHTFHAQLAHHHHHTGTGSVGAVRLVGGRNGSAWEGNVQVCQSGTWGTVCDVGWDDTDARVLCR
mgnify:CR=1 FL=1